MLCYIKTFCNVILSVLIYGYQCLQETCCLRLIISRLRQEVHENNVLHDPWSVMWALNHGCQGKEVCVHMCVRTSILHILKALYMAEVKVLVYAWKKLRGIWVGIELRTLWMGSPLSCPEITRYCDFTRVLLCIWCYKKWVQLLTLCISTSSYGITYIRCLDPSTRWLWEVSCTLKLLYFTVSRKKKSSIIDTYCIILQSSQYIKYLIYLLHIHGWDRSFIVRKLYGDGSEVIFDTQQVQRLLSSLFSALAVVFIQLPYSFMQSVVCLTAGP